MSRRTALQNNLNGRIQKPPTDIIELFERQIADRHRTALLAVREIDLQTERRSEIGLKRPGISILMRTDARE